MCVLSVNWLAEVIQFNYGTLLPVCLLYYLPDALLCQRAPNQEGSHFIKSFFISIPIFPSLPINAFTPLPSLCQVLLLLAFSQHGKSTTSGHTCCIFSNVLLICSFHLFLMYFSSSILWFHSVMSVNIFSHEVHQLMLYGITTGEPWAGVRSAWGVANWSWAAHWCGWCRVWLGGGRNLHYLC